jgi:hypothetical protein
MTKSNKIIPTVGSPCSLSSKDNTMISSSNIYSMDPISLMYFFDKRMKRLLLNHKDTKDLTDHQIDLIENTILPAIENALQEDVMHVS